MRFPRTLLLASVLAACGAEAAGNHVRIYVSLDEQFSRPVLDGFAKELGITLDQQHDTEASKTVGPVSAIVEERNHPRASVFWNNELANTVHLAEQGLLASYDSPAAQDIPSQWRDPQHRWTAFAARARILVVNTELLPDAKTWPSSYRDLVDARWKGRCAVARPINGTTLTHFTAMRKVLGDAAFQAWIDGMFANEVQFLAGNAATLRAVREGTLAWAFTDTDDYHEAVQKGFPIACVFPDQEPLGIGTMLIPNSVALIKGGPNQDAAKQLIDKILSRDTEALLAASDSAQIPLRTGIPGPKDPGIKAPGEFRAMVWDVAWTAANLATFSHDFGKRFGL